MPSHLLINCKKKKNVQNPILVSKSESKKILLVQPSYVAVERVSQFFFQDNALQDTYK